MGGGRPWNWRCVLRFHAMSKRKKNRDPGKKTKKKRPLPVAEVSTKINVLLWQVVGKKGQPFQGAKKKKKKKKKKVVIKGLEAPRATEQWIRKSSRRVRRGRCSQKKKGRPEGKKTEKLPGGPSAEEPSTMRGSLGGAKPLPRISGERIECHTKAHGEKKKQRKKRGGAKGYHKKTTDNPRRKKKKKSGSGKGKTRGRKQGAQGRGEGAPEKKKKQKAVRRRGGRLG